MSSELGEPDPISRDKFMKYVQQTSKVSDDSPESFDAQIRLINVNAETPMCDARSTGKDRYENVRPSEDHRVKLCGGGDDYINASYYDPDAESAGSPWKYIMAQAPVEEAFDDFWKMVWDERCFVILMITKLKESDVIKADQYWPRDNQPSVYGEITVTLTGVEPNQGGLIRTFKLDHNGDSRTIEHIQYTSWPDHGVPRDYQSVVKLFAIYREARNRMYHNDPTSGRILMHCSAGIGRTGTFVTIDTVLDYLANTEEPEPVIDVYRRVLNLRKYRPGAIQTKDQYIFCFRFISFCLDHGYLDVNKNYGKQ